MVITFRIVNWFACPLVWVIDHHLIMMMMTNIIMVKMTIRMLMNLMMGRPVDCNGGDGAGSNKNICSLPQSQMIPMAVMAMMVMMTTTMTTMMTTMMMMTMTIMIRTCMVGTSLQAARPRNHFPP